MQKIVLSWGVLEDIPNFMEKSWTEFEKIAEVPGAHTGLIP